MQDWTTDLAASAEERKQRTEQAVAGRHSVSVTVRPVPSGTGKELGCTVRGRAFATDHNDRASNTTSSR